MPRDIFPIESFGLVARSGYSGAMTFLLGLTMAAGLAHAELLVRPIEPIAALKSVAAAEALSVSLPLALNIPEIAAVPRPEGTLAELRSFQRSIEMRGGGAERSEEAQGQDSARLWDGDEAKGYAQADGFALAELNPRRREELLHAHAEIPALDYRRGSFNLEGAVEFLGMVHYSPRGGQVVTGRELLELVLTPHAVVLDVPLEPSRVDMSLFGKSDTQLRSLALQKGIPVFVVHDFMLKAFTYGMVYRVTDVKGGRTYYGIPYEVRQALELKSPELPAPSPVKELPRQSAFGEALIAIARDALALEKNDEIFEFTAQIIQTAIKDGHLRPAQLPAEFLRRSEAIDLGEAPLSQALLTLLESSHGTPWFDKALALCRHAAEAGIMDRRVLESTLEDLRRYPRG